LAKLRVGILGLRRGLSHLRNFMAVKDAEVIGAADRIEQWRDRAAEMVDPQRVKLVREFEELLELRPDAVVVASNGRHQAEDAIRALAAGCHVMSEVPGAFTHEEINHIILHAERYGRQYMLAENSCFLDFLRYWRKWILEDRFGPISIAEAEYLHYLPDSMIDQENNRYSPTQWREQDLQGLSPLWRADQPPIQYLTHDLGPLLEVLDDRVVSVTCMSGPYWCSEAPLRSDGQIALYRTAKGSLIKIMVTLNTRRPGAHNYRLFGTAGSAEWYSHEGFCRRFGRERSHDQGWERIDIGTASSSAARAAGHGGTDIQTALYFTQAVLEGKRVPIDVFRMADFTLPGILAAHSAELGGQPIVVPDLRRGPYEGTQFWDHVGLPETEPEGTDYVSTARVTF
jgi:predicted dehydrogenase